MRISCPHCGFGFDASEGRAGLGAVCPRCQRSFDAFATGETVELQPPGGEETTRAIGPRSTRSDPSDGSDRVGRQFEEYRIVEEIGRGGMGVVYKAVQETLDRPVALKMILAGEAARSKEIQHFLREAAAAARLRHPNIVSVHELDVHQGTYYYTMDYIEGPGLADLIGEEGMDGRRAAGLAEKVARALAHAHGKGIVHRDLKPGNVLIDENGEPMITDFGLAFDLRRGAEGEGPRIAGTPGYMAPEQILGVNATAGPACDIYSLGALLYEMLTGRPPFAGGSMKELLEAITETAPQDPTELRPGLDPKMRDIVTKCLQKNPEDRYRSAAELADALAGWLAGPGAGEA